MIELTEKELRLVDPASMSPGLRKAYDDYVKYRFIGVAPAQAAKLCNIPFEEIQSWIHTAEADPYVRVELAKRIGDIDISKAWNAKKSIWTLLTMLDDPYTKCTTRLNAIKELNVLAGITFVDEKGNTRARKLEDFYKEEGHGVSGDGKQQEQG